MMLCYLQKWYAILEKFNHTEILPGTPIYVFYVTPLGVPGRDNWWSEVYKYMQTGRFYELIKVDYVNTLIGT